MGTKTTPPKEKELTLSSKIILDYFYCDGKKIVVLDNKAFKNIPDDELILAQLIEGEKEDLLESITDEEYQKAVRKYQALINMLDEEDENE